MTLIPRRPVIQLYQLVSGRRFLHHLDELNRTQWLDRDELLNLQRVKLHRLLEKAYTYVPYYRRLFDDVGFKPDDILRDMKFLQKIPFLTKDIIRANLEDLQTTDPQIQPQLSSLSTSGSSGQPLQFVQDHAFRDYVTADVHRHLGWAGWTLGAPHCYIWGASFEVAAKQTTRARLMDWVLNRFVTNAYILSEESMNRFIDQIRQRKPLILFSYPSSLNRFAEFVRDNNLNDIKFKAILSSAEVLYPNQRQFIEETFDCKIFDRYGTREIGGIGCQCEFHTGMHVSVENVYVEIINESGELAQPGEVGRIIITNLNNQGMPFIRYHLADTISWRPETTCPCGRSHPMLDVVQGRENDMFRSRDGRMIWGGIANPLWEIKEVKKFQYIQKTYDHVLVRIVKEGALAEKNKHAVERAIKTALGQQTTITFEFPEDIPTEKSGKYRYQICEVQEAAIDKPRLQESN